MEAVTEMTGVKRWTKVEKNGRGRVMGITRPELVSIYRDSNSSENIFSRSQRYLYYLYCQISTLIKVNRPSPLKIQITGRSRVRMCASGTTVRTLEYIRYWATGTDSSNHMPNNVLPIEDTELRTADSESKLQLRSKETAYAVLDIYSTCLCLHYYSPSSALQLP